jgi:hypothetical protein
MEVADLQIALEPWFDRILLVSGDDAVTMLTYPGDRDMLRQALRLHQAHPAPSSIEEASSSPDRVRTGDRACGPDKTGDAIKQGNVTAAVFYQIAVTWLRNALCARRAKDTFEGGGICDAASWLVLPALY